MRVKLKLNKPLKGLPAGHTLTLEADICGNVKDKYWSRRVKDSLSDKCVEFLPDESKKKNSGDK